MTIMVLSRENAEILTMPYEGGYLEQPVRTMASIGVIQEVFADRLRQEYESYKRGSRKG